MNKARLEAFSDGVLAIIITILVLELKAPHGEHLADLRPLLPTLLTYLLSFVYVGIYWNNHHHTLHAAKRVSGRVLWANLHLLFWLSLLPFVTAWLGENHFAAVPTALYGGVLLMAAIAYWILVRSIIAAGDENLLLAKAIGSDRKGNLSVLIYAVSILVALEVPWLAQLGYVGVALMWLVPDRRIERVLEQHRS